MSHVYIIMRTGIFGDDVFEVHADKNAAYRRCCDMNENNPYHGNESYIVKLHKIEQKRTV